MNCPKCNSIAVKNGTTKDGKQKYRCNNCKNNFEVRNGEEPILEIETSGIGISETQLRAKHDLRFIVESKCKQLQKGMFLTQSEFISFCKINAGSGYRNVIEHPDYEKYHGRVSGIIYWSHPDSIKKYKDEGVLI